MYGREFEAEALRVLVENDGSCRETARQLGGVAVRTPYRWRDELAGFPWKRYTCLTAAQKRGVARRLEDGAGVRAVAREYGVRATAVCAIRDESRAKGALAFMDVAGNVEIPDRDPSDLPDDVEALGKRCEELGLGNAILARTIEILKKDPGVDPSEMTDREKTTVIGALRDRFSVSVPCGGLGISRSSYYYAGAAARAGDRYARERRRIGLIFRNSRRTFGSERIWMTLRTGGGGAPGRISEKVVRRIMREEGLTVTYNKRRRGYGSHKGEISAHPGDGVARDFHADAPNRLWLTDITRFALAGFRCCLSVIVDCFGGKVVSHGLSKSPNAQLANSTLVDAIRVLGNGETPILHSDCGCRYRWPERIGICEKHGITRSVSRKACSPDNAACEGFFGRLKNDFFHHKTWDSVTFGEFNERLDEYIRYRNKQRRKKSLGWKSPEEYRLSLGYAA